MQPDNKEVKLNLARTYAGAGQYDEAASLLTDIITEAPDNYDACIELGKVYIAKSDDASARKWLTYVQLKDAEYRSDEIQELLSQL